MSSPAADHPSPEGKERLTGNRALAEIMIARSAADFDGGSDTVRALTGPKRTPSKDSSPLMRSSL